MKPVGYLVSIPPTEFPITLGDVKRYGVIEHNDDDPLLMDLISDATDYAQHYMNTQIVSATYEIYYPSFDDSLELPIRPIVSVDSIQYYDTDNVQQTLDAASYNGNIYGIEPAITLNEGYSWPSVGSTINPITVTATVGYGPADAVPGTIKRAIAMLVRHFDENREGVAFTNSAEMPHSITSLLQRYRKMQGV